MGSIAFNRPHVLVFPFMAKGHTIPLLQFGRFLLGRDLTVTVVTTPANRPFVVESLRDTTASIVDIPIPDEISDIPCGFESTDKLPSASLFHKFAAATARLQAHFERLPETLPRVSFMGGGELGVGEHLCWRPLMAEHLSARMVEEEMKVGLRVETCMQRSSERVKEAGEGEMGKQVRNKVQQLVVVANKALQEGGSSLIGRTTHAWSTLDWRDYTILLHAL